MDSQWHPHAITSDRSTYTHVAAYFGSRSILRKMLDNFPQTRHAVNVDGSTPLHMATAGGHLDIIKSIIEESPDDLSVTENDGWTIAHIACFHGHVEILDLIELHCAHILFKKDMNGLLPSDVCVEDSCREFFLSMDVAKSRSEKQVAILTSKDCSPLEQRPTTTTTMGEQQTVLPLALTVGLNPSPLVHRDFSPVDAGIGEGESEYGSFSSGGDDPGDNDMVIGVDLTADSNRKGGDSFVETLLQTARAQGVDSPFAVHLQHDEADTQTPKGSNSVPVRETSRISSSATVSANGKDTPVLKAGANGSGEWQQDTTTKEQQSRWKSLLSSLKQGTDISRIQIPAEFLRPESALERIQDLMQHGKLLEDIPFCNNPIERMIAVVRFHVSGIIRAAFDGKKPYNPVIGETFAVEFDHQCETGGFSRLLCEQVSHHPPISAYHLENQKLGIRIQGSAEISPKFMGNSVEVPFKGERKLQLESCKEEYVMTVPNLQYRGLFVGSRGAEWVGHVSVCCQQTNLVCKLHFKPLGWLGLWGGWHHVEGHIKQTRRKQLGLTKDLLFKISGQWDKVLYLNDAKTGDTSTLYDFEFSKAKKSTAAKLCLSHLDTDSKKVWKKLSEALQEGEMRAANKEKSAIENNQRRLRQERAAKGLLWEPRFFRRVQQDWCLKEASVPQF